MSIEENTKMKLTKEILDVLKNKVEYSRFADNVITISNVSKVADEIMLVLNNYNIEAQEETKNGK
jgi:hypothetical protein